MTNQSTELISRAKAGDEAAWQQLYAEYYPFIHHVACDILGDANAADDVASEVFLSLFEDKHILATRHSLVAFLRIKTHNLVIDVLRKDRTFQKLARLYHAVRDEVVMPQGMEAKELGQQLALAIAGIPGERRRRTFILAYVEEKKSKEIAELLNISQQTVKNNIAAALKHLRQKLKNTQNG